MCITLHALIVQNHTRHKETVNSQNLFLLRVGCYPGPFRVHEGQVVHHGQTARTEIATRIMPTCKLCMESGAHHPERPSPTLSLRENLCPDWAIFRIVSRERLSPLQSAYGRNQRGKGKDWLRKTDEGCGTSFIFFSVDCGHIRTAVETEVHGKYISKNSSIWA